MVSLQDLAAGAPADRSLYPFPWHLANPRWWDDLYIAPFHPTIPPQVRVPDVTQPTFSSTTSLQWYRGASCTPPFISSEPPVHTEPLPDPPHGVMGSPDPAPDRVGPSQPPLNFVEGNCSTWARAHKCTNVCKLHKKTASNRHAAPSDSTAAVPVLQETDMRSPYEPRPLLPLTCMHAGGLTRGLRTNQGVHTGNICVNSRVFT